MPRVNFIGLAEYLKLVVEMFRRNWRPTKPDKSVPNVLWEQSLRRNRCAQSLQQDIVNRAGRLAVGCGACGPDSGSMLGLWRAAVGGKLDHGSGHVIDLGGWCCGVVDIVDIVAVLVAVARSYTKSLTNNMKNSKDKRYLCRQSD